MVTTSDSGARELPRAPAALLPALAARLASAGRDEARLKAELLVAHVLGIGRLALPDGAPAELTAVQAEAVGAWAARVAAGEPLQYVLGEAWFRGRPFLVDARVLIPRPETEELVDLALGHAALRRREEPRVADVGTGSGCIAVSLAVERPGARVLALDVSDDALAVARVNAERAGVARRIAFRVADLLEGVPAGSLDAVVSNPPYVASEVIGTLAEEVRAHEPRLALDGGPDGLRAIRRLAEQAFTSLRPGGTLFLEMGDEQGPAVRHILGERGFARVEIRRDLAGHERMAKAERP